MIHALLTAFYLIVILWVIGRSSFFNIKGLSPRILQGVMIVKVLAGLALWAIYTHHYSYRNTSDSFRYFDDARVVFGMLGDDPSMFFRFLLGINLDAPDTQVYFDQMRGWTSSYSYGIINDNPTIIRINVLINLLSFGHYHVHTVLMSFFSLLGGVAMVKGFSKMTRIPKIVLVFGCLLLPSALLWTSSVLKEAPMMMALGFLTYNAILWYKNGLLKNLLITLILCGSMFFIKGYVVLVFIPALFFLIVVRFVKERNLLAFGVTHLLVLLFAVTGIYNAGDLSHVLHKKQTDFVNVGMEQEAGSLIEPLDVSTPSSQVKAIPRAWYRAYLRPDFRDMDSIFHVGLGVEAWMMVLIGTLAIIFRRKTLIPSEKVILLFCWSFVLSLGLVIGICVPILGAIVRYKVPALPFLAVGLLTLLDFDLFRSKIRAIRKLVD